MPVKHASNIEAAQRRHRENMAEDQNFAAKQHLSWADFRVPVNKGRLQKSLRQTQEATTDKPTAVVMAGGVEVDGEVVDYAAIVNAKDPFWTESEEVGREAIKRRAANRRRETRQRGRRGF